MSMRSGAARWGGEVPVHVLRFLLRAKAPLRLSVADFAWGTAGGHFIRSDALGPLKGYIGPFKGNITDVFEFLWT